MNDNSHNGGYVPVFRMAMLHPRWLGTWLILGIVRLLVYLPRSFASLAGAGIGDLFYRLNKKRRRVTQANLRLCFPEMPDDERYRLMRRHYRVYGQTFVDMGLIWWASERFIDRYVRFRGLDYYRQVRESGKQVILLTGHFVAIDIGGPVISRHYKQIGLINTIDNEVLDWILGRGRVRFGSRMLLRDRGMRQVVQHIRDGFGFSYVPDEDFGPEKSVFVPFLGTEAPTLTSVGKLARMSNAAVLPCFVWRRSAKEGYLVDIRPPLQEFPTGDELADAVRVRQVLADAVREHPEQYMWTFKFFRSRPNGETPPY